MKNTFSFKKHFARSGIYYICGVSATLLVLFYSINLKLKAKDYETFSVFVGEYDINIKSLKEKLEDVLGKDIIQINTYHVSSTSTSYSNLYTTQGYSSDLLIIPDDVIYDSDVKAFIELPVSYQSETDYVFDESHKGLRLFDGENGIWNDLISYQKKSYYLFINPKSVHLKGINEEGKTDAVIKVLEDISNEEK